jgi:transcriptional regulator with XRE-family HTH domain
VDLRGETENALSEQRQRWSPGRIGELVADYRRERGLKVSELARQVGVTPSLISQIERGNSRPSVATLFGLAEALDVSLDVFADRSPATETATAREPLPSTATTVPAPPPAPAAGDRYVVSRNQRRTISVAGGVTWEMLTPSRHDQLEFIELVYAPHAESNEALYRHPGFETVLVLSGRFQIQVGFDQYTLEPGDSISFPSSLPHRYANPDDQEARAVTAILRDQHPSDGAEPPRPS